MNKQYHRPHYFVPLKSRKAKQRLDLSPFVIVAAVPFCMYMDGWHTVIDAKLHDLWMRFGLAAYWAIEQFLHLVP